MERSTPRKAAAGTPSAMPSMRHRHGVSGRGRGASALPFIGLASWLRGFACATDFGGIDAAPCGFPAQAGTHSSEAHAVERGGPGVFFHTWGFVVGGVCGFGWLVLFVSL